MSDKPWKVFERAVAKGFSNWITDDADEQVICRQALLGRMVESVYGDLALNPKSDPCWREAGTWFMSTFMVDAKNRKVFSLSGLLTAPAHPFWGWWYKLEDDAVRAGGKIPLLVVIDKSTRARLIAIGEKTSALLEDKNGGPNVAYLDVNAGISIKQDPALSSMEVRTLRIKFMKFDNFFEWVSPYGLGCPHKSESTASRMQTQGDNDGSKV